MGTYRVTDPDSGVTLDLTGDSPPTEQELEQVFANFKSEKEVPKVEPMGAENIPVNIPGNAGSAVGVGEDILNKASSMVAKPVSDVMGLAATAKDVVTGNMTGDPEGFKRSIEESLTYQPKTVQGQDISQSAYHPLNLIGRGINWAAEGLGSFGEESGKDTPLGMLGNMVEEATRQAPAVLGAKYAGKARLAEKQARLDVLKGNNQLLDAARNEAQNAGFVTPAETGVRSQVSGVAKSDQVISRKNTVTATELVKEEIGVPQGEPISGSILDTIKEQHYRAYNDVVKGAAGEYKNLRIKTTPEYINKMQEYLDEIDGPLKEYPESNKGFKQPKKLFQEQIRKESHSPKEMMRNIRQLRSEADILYRKTNAKPSDTYTAAAKLSIANGLELLLESYLTKLGKSDLVPAFRNARMKLAQVHVVEKALNETTGTIDIKAISKASEKSRLTGNLKTVSNFGKAFPSGAMSLKGAPHLIGLFDTVVAGTSIIAGHPGWAVLEMGGRLGIPAGARMGWLQNKTPSYKATNTTSKAVTAAGATVPSYQNR